MLNDSELKELWEWAGFKLSTNKRESHFKQGERVPHWVTPDGNIPSDSLGARGRLPPPDMNNFYKWVEPELPEFSLQRFGKGKIFASIDFPDDSILNIRKIRQHGDTPEEAAYQAAYEFVRGG